MPLMSTHTLNTTLNTNAGLWGLPNAPLQARGGASHEPERAKNLTMTKPS